MRLDAQYLANNPAGEEKAEFTLRTDVPDGAGVPLNPDNSRQQVEVQVVADTYMPALILLSQMHGEPQTLLGQWLTKVMTPKQAQEASEAARLGQPPVLARQIAGVNHRKPLTFDTAVRFQLDGDAAEHSVELRITAPSIILGVQGFTYITRPEAIHSLSDSFRPDGE